MKKGDLVKMHDCSYVISIQLFNPELCLGNGSRDSNKATYVIIGDAPHDHANEHDVFIKDNQTGDIFLHSTCFLTKIQPSKEVTMAELEEFYGCKVKVVK